MMHVGDLQQDVMGRVRRSISVERLLHWAFADECASVDFEDPGTLARGHAMIGNAYLMAQRGALGCRIDGGGRSYPDADADLVAAAVACLPEGVGGRSMAVQIAELSRKRSRPEVYLGAKPRVEPVAWRQNRYGRVAATEHIYYVTDLSGRKPRRHDVRICPIVYRPDATVIARARRSYLQWRLALLELRETFKIRSDLSRWVVSDDLPPRTPWQKKVDE